MTLLAGAGCGAPTASAPGADGAKAEAGEAGWFVEITEAAGLDFVHETGATGELLLPEIMGSGAAIADLDGDGRLDLYLVNGAWNLGRPQGAAGLGRDGKAALTNRFYRQREDGTFEDATAASGLGDTGYGMGVAVGDVDNDGHEDLFVANLDEDRLYRNRGDGTFEEISRQAGTAVAGWSSSAAFLDFDRDGFLDLFIVRYVAYDADNPCYDMAGRREYCGPTAFPGVHDVLLHNRGDGTFEDVSAAAGIDRVAHAGLGLVVRDFDGDGWSDVYVANDADPNELWHNQGDGTFRDEALLLGASVNAQGQPEAGMGVLAEDLDGDLDIDLFMTHLGDEKNTLYRNLGGEQGFEDASSRAGLAASSMAFTGFGTAALDADLDGELDLLVANGRVFRGELLPGDLPAPWNAYAEPNLFYRGQGGGLFEDSPAEGRAFTARTEISRGLAVGDLDGDGDLDLLLANTQGPARLFRGEAPRHGSWLLLDAWDPRLKRRALGAEIVVKAGGKTWLRTLSGASSYQSAHDPRAHFGLGVVDAVDEVRIRWPDGLRERFRGLAVNQAHRLLRGEGEAL